MRSSGVKSGEIRDTCDYITYIYHSAQVSRSVVEQDFSQQLEHLNLEQVYIFLLRFSQSHKPQQYANRTWTGSRPNRLWLDGQVS
jgi:hypothetical protein